MSEHTKEPWNHLGDEVKTADGNLIAVTLLGTSLIENQDNARRIVACVNACAGIDNKTLEEVGVVPKIVIFNGVTMKAVKSDYKQQRDELLATAKNLRDVKGRYNTEIAMKRLIEAINKVESEK